MTRRAVVRIYQAPDGWRWSFSRNGRVRADGGQGYTRHIDCWRGMVDSLGIRSSEPIPTRDGPAVYRLGVTGSHERLRLVDEGKP